jgi:Co/Zn/Cd efflux system component
MSCDCHLEAASEEQNKLLRTLLAINGTMFAAEVVVGVVADSSGVLADSLDMLADALVYGVALFSVGRTDAMKERAAKWSGWFQICLAVSISLDVIRVRCSGASQAHS